MRWRKKNRPESKPLKLVLLTALAGLACALIGVGSLMEDMLRVTRNGLHTHPASGDIVFVKIDDKSLRAIGRWPWPRRYHADLTDRLTEAGARRIFFDVTFETGSNPRDDRALTDALKRSGRVILPVRSHMTADGELPIYPELAEVAELATISVDYNHQNAAWKLPYEASLGEHRMPGMASRLANRPGPSGKLFPVDYSTDPGSVRTVSAADVLDGTADARQVRGKDVVIGAASEALGDQYFIPGWGKMAGAYIQILGAETLKRGVPVDLGWIPAFLLSLIVAAIALYQSRASIQNALLSALGVTLLVAPIFLEPRLIFVDVVPGLVVVSVIASVLVSRRFRKRGLIDTISGLPNLTALRADKAGRDKTLIAAKVMNYAEIVAALPANGEADLVRQIVSRLAVGSTNRLLYQGDGGIFAWFEESRIGIGHHIEALYSLMRNPVRVASLSIDLAVSFGVDVGSSRSISNRLGSALVAAEEAAHEGLKWKFYDPDALQNASWKLSMLSQLDGAIDNGEVWIAFQPKLDLSTNRVIGAEALARWTHPEKGPIAASEFVAAAEQHDRIGKLTMFVLDKAIAAAATINQRGHGFDVAVNLSGRLLSDRSLTKTISSLLQLHDLAPGHLTLELTETAALAGSGDALDMLASLRELGVRISIDDYGTGFSTLEYLKKIPAAEIKIDQSFVKGMCDNRSDRLMVQSTIGLAHSLGRKVVAEGVEQRTTLELLVAMKCDIAQGYVVGRPMSLGSLIKRLTLVHRQEVA